MGVWLGASLTAIAGAGLMRSYRRRRGASMGLGHYLVGAYAGLAVAVGIAFAVDTRIAAAVLGAGVVAAAFAAMLVAGVRGRTASSPVTPHT